MKLLLTAGTVGVLTVLQLGIQPELAAGLLLSGLLIAVSITDLREMRIPDVILAPVFLAIILLRLWIHPLPLWNYIAACLAGFGIMYIIAVIGWRVTGQMAMGGGDIKLLAVIGLFAGIEQTLLALLLGSLMGLVAGIGLRCAGRLLARQALPFGPFLAAGSWISYLWGMGVIDWYNAWLLNSLV